MPDVVIIGAGVGGLMAAFGLKRKLGLDDIVIYERGADVGGTWNGNTYPGAASDTLIHFYSLSYAPNPDWSRMQGSHKEIQAYWRGLAHKFDVHRRIRFNRDVVSAEWDAERSVWTVVTQNNAGVGNGEAKRDVVTARVLISAVGILDIPRKPQIPGIDTFKGTLFHSREWRGDVQLSGKKVAVIGNGASATQFVPIITQDPTTEVTSFVRTPAWYVSSAQSQYSGLAKWAFRWIPLVMWLHRMSIFCMFELWYLFLFSNKTRFMRGWVNKKFIAYIKRHAPKEYQDKLIPKYEIGCKRVVFDTQYLDSLHRPNHNLNWDGIAQITGNGIKTKTGEQLSFDVIITATGFVADKFPIPIRGANGLTVQEYYDAEGYPKAYKGTSVPGFPNMFLMAGPNTTTGHTSVTLFEEIQTEYIATLVRPLFHKRNPVASVDVTPAATEKYNTWLHGRLAHSVHTGCVSWYRTGSGAGKISSIFPGPATMFWWVMRRVRLGDYVAKGY